MLNIYDYIEKLKLVHIFSIGFFFRLFLIFFLTVYPFYYPGTISKLGASGLYGPFIYQDNDLTFYLQLSQISEKLLFKDFFATYLNVITLNFDLINDRYPGPLFGLIVRITNYNLNNPYFLSLFIILSELFAFYLWIKYFIKNFDKLLSLLFCFMPIPLY